MSQPVEFILAAEELLGELESHELVVALVPSKRYVNCDGCIRVCMSKNCNWYRAFCAQYASGRKRNHKKFDTRIKRRQTISSLKQVIKGRAPSGVYAERLRPIIVQRAQSLALPCAL